MDINTPEAKSYLVELYNMTSGNVGAQVSMFEVGSAIGMEKEAAGKVAENLIGNGLATVKTLSGGIGITDSGIEAVQADGGAGQSPTANFDLGSGPVLEDRGREAVARLLKDIQNHISQNATDYQQLEEMVIDLKTIEVQLLSPKPKTAVIREVFRSLQSALNAGTGTDLSSVIGSVIAV